MFAVGCAVLYLLSLFLSLKGHLSERAELNQLHLIPDGAMVTCWHIGQRARASWAWDEKAQGMR